MRSKSTHRHVVAPRFDPNWARSASGRYQRLVFLEPDRVGLAGESGIFVIWHAGVAPAWIYVDHASDLGEALLAAMADPVIMSYEANGGLFVTWAGIAPDYCEGMVCHLARALRPVIKPRSCNLDEAFPIPVVAPGSEPVRAYCRGGG